MQKGFYKNPLRFAWLKGCTLRVIYILPLRVFGFEWRYLKYNSGNPYYSTKVGIIQYREYIR